MAQKKAKLNEHYTSEEVQDLLNNTVIAILRWDKLKDFKEVRGKSLREFTQGIVDALTKEVLYEEDKPLHLLIPPEEIVLALISSAVLIMYQYCIEDEKKRKTFLQGLVS